MNIRTYLLAFIILIPAIVSSQKLTSKQWDEIQKSNNYLIGMGVDTSLEKARQTALSDLAGKISTNVESRFDYLIDQKTKNREIESESNMKKIIRSYSSVTLDNVAEHIEQSKDGYVVYRYMKNSDLRAMFKRRVNLAKKWAKEAQERELEGKIGDALQDYYWSLALLRSCPDGDLETIAREGGEEVMTASVYQRVKDILDAITVKATAVENEDGQQRVSLHVIYRNKPAVNFNYKFCDTDGCSEVYRVKDGDGELLLPASFKLKRLKVTAEYECRDEANIHPDLQSVMESTDPVPFKAAELLVDTKDCQAVQAQDYAVAIAPVNPIEEVNGTTTVTEAMSPYLTTIQAIEKAIANRQFGTVRGCFTSEGWDMFQKLIAYGDAKLLRAPEVQFSDERDGVVCRSFPMSFTFRGNKRTFTEDVVFYLDKQAKVREVAFGLEKAAVDDIMSRVQWSLEARQVMVHFMETYKTAFALKRWDYINSIFSNDALIITGSVVKSAGHKELGIANVRQVKYTRQTKEEYMKNLQRCFDSNEYINIRFADNIVRRSAEKTDIYGIQIKQDYFSSSYGDTGYLFLLIDFEKPDAPLIHVRTWQPDKDPDIRDGRIGMADFNL